MFIGIKDGKAGRQAGLQVQQASLLKEVRWAGQGRARFVQQQPKTAYSIDPSQMSNALGRTVYRVLQRFLAASYHYRYFNNLPGVTQNVHISPICQALQDQSYRTDTRDIYTVFHNKPHLTYQSGVPKDILSHRHLICLSPVTAVQYKHLKYLPGVLKQTLSQETKISK